MDTDAQDKSGTKQTETPFKTIHFILNHHHMTGLSHCIVTEVAAPAAAAEVCQLPVHPAAVWSSATKSCRCRATKRIPSGRL